MRGSRSGSCSHLSDTGQSSSAVQYDVNDRLLTAFVDRDEQPRPIIQLRRTEAALHGVDPRSPRRARASLARLLRDSGCPHRQGTLEPEPAASPAWRESGHPPASSTMCRRRAEREALDGFTLRPSACCGGYAVALLRRLLSEAQLTRPMGRGRFTATAGSRPAHAPTTLRAGPSTVVNVGPCVRLDWCVSSTSGRTLMRTVGGPWASDQYGYS